MLLSKVIRSWVNGDNLEQFVSVTVDFLHEGGRLEAFYPEP